MRNATVFTAKVRDDLTLEFINPARFKQHLLPLKGKIVEITAELQRRHRSNEQNRYYWGVVLKMIADYCGYFSQEEIESLHTEMCRLFLPGVGMLALPTRTSDLSTVEMNDYMKKVRAWAASELGVYIPEPNEIKEA